MPSPTAVERTHVIPVTPAVAFAGTAPIDLSTLFTRWYGPIPPIAEVRDQTGSWDTVGQTRTVVLTGGGSMREELVSFDAPHSFGYRLTNVTGPLALLVDHVDGRWDFSAAGGGTSVRWSWVIHPRSALAAPLMPVFAALWRGYARRSLAVLSAFLVTSPR